MLLSVQLANPRGHEPHQRQGCRQGTTHRQDLGAAWHAIRDATSLGDAERAAILGGTAATVFFPH